MKLLLKISFMLIPFSPVLVAQGGIGGIPSIPVSFLNNPQTTIPIDDALNLTSISMPQDVNRNATPQEVKREAKLQVEPRKRRTSNNEVLPKEVREDFSKKDYMVEAGKNLIIPIAVNFPNRLVTPFSTPKIVQVSAKGTPEKDHFKIKDNVIYVLTTQTKPIVVFITDGDDQTNAISITLVPKKVPPRELTLSLKNAGTNYLFAGAENKKAKVWEEKTPYLNVIVSLFKELALGNIPQSYTLSETTVETANNLPDCNQRGLEFDFLPGQTLVGHNMGVYIGLVQNVSDQEIEFEGQSCAGWDVKAVASWPYLLIKPNQKSEVYVAFSINRRPATKRENRRQSLIFGDGM